MRSKVFAFFVNSQATLIHLVMKVDNKQISIVSQSLDFMQLSFLVVQL